MVKVVARWNWGKTALGPIEVRVVRLAAGYAVTCVAVPEYPDDEGVDIAGLKGGDGCLIAEVLRRLVEAEAIRAAAARFQAAAGGDGEAVDAALQELLKAAGEAAP